MPLYTISIHDPETRERVHTLPHNVLAPTRWQAVKEVVECYGFTRAWMLRGQEVSDATHTRAARQGGAAG